ncbi:hypothetical protein, partial [Mycobacteroides abscessus]|uniref:hypothetical protein n=1 Tax=Mycobacteroides abscessus TaxID=36809 RepID=UPI00374351EB
RISGEYFWFIVFHPCFKNGTKPRPIHAASGTWLTAGVPALPSASRMRLSTKVFPLPAVPLTSTFTAWPADSGPVIAVIAEAIPSNVPEIPLSRGVFSCADRSESGAARGW